MCGYLKAHWFRHAERWVPVFLDLRESGAAEARVKSPSCNTVNLLDFILTLLKSVK
jgi:hypothetical protein